MMEEYARFLKVKEKISPLVEIVCVTKGIPVKVIDEFVQQWERDNNNIQVILGENYVQ